MYTSTEANVARAKKVRKTPRTPVRKTTTAARPGGGGSAEVPHGARPDTVFEQLRDSIVRGRLAPGTPMMEVEIAQHFGVSRTPVRDALQRLHSDGLIVRTPRRPFKFSVAPLTRDDARSLYRIVAELDGLAAHDAASAPAAERRALARDLRALNEELRAAAESERHPHVRMYELDHAFHDRYIGAGASPRLLSLFAAIKPQIERYARVYVLLLPHEIHMSVREHEALVKAVERGRADEAQEAARNNWRNAADRLARAIDEMGERGRL